MEGPKSKSWWAQKSRALSPAMVKSLVEGRAYSRPLTWQSSVLCHLRPLHPEADGRWPSSREHCQLRQPPTASAAAAWVAPRSSQMQALAVPWVVTRDPWAAELSSEAMSPRSGSPLLDWMPGSVMMDLRCVSLLSCPSTRTIRGRGQAGYLPVSVRTLSFCCCRLPGTQGWSGTCPGPARPPMLLFVSSPWTAWSEYSF